MRDLERVSGFLDQVLRRFGIPDPVDLGRLVEEWEDLAGDPWGSRSRPAGLADGELLVEVDDGSLATLLRYQQGVLLDRLERRLGPGLVTSVRIRVNRAKKASDQGF
jgi:predicted nucleic acid-binding Zn ribbon protein